MNPTDWQQGTDERLGKLEACTSAMVDAIAGKQTLGGFRAGGLVQDMAWVKSQLANGGPHGRLAVKDRVALWVAAIGAIAVMIAALAGAFA